MGMAGFLMVAQMGVQMSQQKKVQAQMQNAQQSQKELQDLQMQREQQRLIAEQQQANADITAAAAAQGVQGSSMELGAKSSLSSQLATELNFLDQSAELQNEMADAQTEINKIQGQSNLTSSVFDVAKMYV